MGRFVAEIIVLVVLLLVAATMILIGLLGRRAHPAAKREKDIATTPGLWFTYSKMDENGFTEVGIQYVAQRGGEVIERRCMQRIDTDAGNYAQALDAAQDEAYEAQRVANLGLIRR